MTSGKLNCPGRQNPSLPFTTLAPEMLLSSNSPPSLKSNVSLKARRPVDGGSTFRLFSRSRPCSALALFSHSVQPQSSSSIRHLIVQEFLELNPYLIITLCCDSHSAARLVQPSPTSTAGAHALIADLHSRGAVLAVGGRGMLAHYRCPVRSSCEETSGQTRARTHSVNPLNAY